MTRRMLGGFIVAAGALTSIAALPAAAAAHGLPELLTTTRCAHPCTRLIGVYAVRPHVVELSEAAGGELKLRWSSWTATAARGSGTSTVSGMGQTTVASITVRASRPVSGRFTRLELSGKSGGRTFQETLALTGVGGGAPAFTPTQS